jgi:hypothetical protein
MKRVKMLARSSTALEAQTAKIKDNVMLDKISSGEEEALRYLTNE